MEEVWRDVPNKPGYQVSNFGNFRSCRFGGHYRPGRWSPKKLNVHKSGYLFCNFCIDGVYSAENVARVVLTLFVGPCPPGMCACHNDGNPKNNHVDNLRWDTHAGNAADKKIHGTLVEGEEQHLSKLDPEKVSDMRGKRAEGWSIPRLAEYFGVSKATALSACKGETWKSVDTPPVSQRWGGTVDGKKKCSWCGNWKPLEDFYVKDKRKGSLTAHCKSCAITRAKEYSTGLRGGKID